MAGEHKSVQYSLSTYGRLHYLKGGDQGDEVKEEGGSDLNLHRAVLNVTFPLRPCFLPKPYSVSHRNGRDMKHLLRVT
jgi:hypothetical protein